MLLIFNITGRAVKMHQCRSVIFSSFGSGTKVKEGRITPGFGNTDTISKIQNQFCTSGVSISPAFWSQFTVRSSRIYISDLNNDQPRNCYAVNNVCTMILTFDRRTMLAVGNDSEILAKAKQAASTLRCGWNT